MRVAVTGGAGFIGSNIATALVEAQHEVLVIDNLSERGGGCREYVPASAEFALVDVRDHDGIDRVLGSFRPDVLCHQAAQTSVVIGTRDPDYDADVNVGGMLNLLRAAVETGVRKVVFASTAATYGNVESFPIDESTPQRPISPYGISKLAAEHYLQFFARQNPLEYTILRYGNIYGPRQNAHGEGGVVAIFTSRFIAKQGVQINQDGEQTRDFTFVGDVVRVNLLALTEGKNDTFVVGTGKKTSVNDIYRELAALTGFEAPVTKGPSRPTDTRESYFSPEKAGRVLGWRAKTSLAEGLKRTVRFYSEAMSAH